jgi:protein-tyrosine phosphatase
LRQLVEKLGGRAAALRFAFHRLVSGIGGYRRYRDLDWGAVRRLVFVCSGNICRSPYAAERARARGFAVASFGIDAAGGKPANDMASVVARARGVDLSAHVSSRMQDFVPLDGDLLIAMEPRHLRAIRHMARPGNVQVTLAGLWSDLRAPFLPDPYATNSRCFDFVFRLIDESLAQMQAQQAAAKNRSSVH